MVATVHNLAISCGMPFRANEAEESGLDRALRYLTPRKASPEAQRDARECVRDLVDRHGPVVEAYPDWHPLVTNHNPMRPVTTPGTECGYEELDHTVYLRNGFITCPYEHATESVLNSVANLPTNGEAEIKAERLPTTLYHPEATPILVTCVWDQPMLSDGTIPPKLAVPMILEREIPCWRKSSRAEPWETMRSYWLGEPCGKRSSLFINQTTAMKLKRIWLSIIEAGTFGPIKTPQT